MVGAFGGRPEGAPLIRTTRARACVTRLGHGEEWELLEVYELRAHERVQLKRSCRSADLFRH
jgi:hypothetical protein